MKFTVNRVKWQRGVIGAGSLLNDSGNMCCLGFVCRAVGMAPRSILNVGMPDDITTSGERRVRGLLTELSDEAVGVIVSTTLAQVAAEINDNPRLSDAEREHRLTAAFLEDGHTLDFVG